MVKPSMSVICGTTDYSFHLIDKKSYWWRLTGYTRHNNCWERWERLC